MSRINGEKARAAIARKRRTAQRAKDRIGRQELLAAAQRPVEPPKPPKKAVKKAAPVEAKEAAAPAPAPAPKPSKKTRPAAQNA